MQKLQRKPYKGKMYTYVHVSVNVIHVSTTFFGHMIGYWILIGLKKVLWDNNLEFSQGDILIGL